MKILYTIFHLSIFYPILFQIIFGILFWLKKTRFSFSKICLISFISEIIFSFSIFIYNYILVKKCLNPLLELIGVFFAAFIILFVTIIIQLIIYHSFKNVNPTKP